MALQRTELWFIHDVRATSGVSAAPRRTSSTLRCVSTFIRNFILRFSYRTIDRSFIVSLNIPVAIGKWAQIALAVAFVACSLFGLWRLVARTGLRRVLPSLTLFSTQCIWFLLPALLSLTKRFAVPQSRYSTGILAVMHSAQYLWVTSYYAKREATSGQGRSWRPVGYFTILVVGGIALFIPGPWLSSVIFHFDFTRSFLLFTALVNIHHFILDGAIWKLRDGRISTLLLNSRTQVSQNAMTARNGVVAMFRWFAGPDSRARALRVGTAFVLLAWGCIDQVHYYWLQQQNLDDLKHAALLAPYDTPLEMRLAESALRQGLPQQSTLAWQYAIEADHGDSGPRDAYLKYLLRTNRFSESYQLTGEWLKLAPNDTALLINHGILARQLGHFDDAEKSWDRALALDPARADVELLLASELDQQNKLEGAISHYENYLAKMAQRTRSELPPAADLVGVALKVGECNVRANHPDIAVRFYRMAATLAEKTQESKLESFADVAEASLDAKLGQPQQALLLYQRALQIDEGIEDSHNNAADWYAYAVFLERAGFPARFSYASILKSQALLGLHANERDSSAVSRARTELERQLGPEAAGIRRNSEPAWRAALTLNPQAAHLKPVSE